VSHYLQHKEGARRLVHERLAYFNQYYGFPLHKVAIRNQRTRWGSCSSKRNLNFNYRIAFLPSALCDYIIVHELCHVAQLNHSPQFWQLVAQTIPYWREARRALRRWPIARSGLVEQRIMAKLGTL
jgi:predicted metal-dependent hydrolase